MMRRCEAPCSSAAAMKSLRADGQRLGPREARIGRPGGERDGDDRVLDARPERGDEGQRQDRRGNARKMSVMRISTASTQPPK